jgi:RNA polymerase sigma-70 factor (ECF subfamily)
MPSQADAATDLERVFGDPVAFRDWYEGAVSRVYRYLHGRCGGNQALAEDLTQQTLFEAVRNRRQFGGRSHPVTWLIAIARNKLADHYRELERQERRHLQLVVREIAIDPGPGTWSRHERRDEVLEALRGLPAAQRAALVLHYVDGLSVRAVATALHKSESSIESLLSRGRDGFRRAFEGVTDA